MHTGHRHHLLQAMGSAMAFLGMLSPPTDKLIRGQGPALPRPAASPSSFHLALAPPALTCLQAPGGQVHLCVA